MKQKENLIILLGRRKKKPKKMKKIAQKIVFFKTSLYLWGVNL